MSYEHGWNRVNEAYLTDDSYEIIECCPTGEIKRASDLIATLIGIISEHGDLPIMADANGDTYPFSGYCLIVHGGAKKVCI